MLLSVFHNRRWDADIRTLAAVIESGRLGELWRVHSRFDLDDPATLEAGPGGGLLRDLGSHVVDQMLWLLGDVRTSTPTSTGSSSPRAAPTPGSARARAHLGVRSHVESSKINHIEARELRAYGSEGSYRALGTDVQAQAIFAGRRPVDDPEGWGYEQPARWGMLATAAGEVSVPSEQGRYHDFYTPSPRPYAVKAGSRSRRRRHPHARRSGRGPAQRRAGQQRRDRCELDPRGPTPVPGVQLWVALAMNSVRALRSAAGSPMA